MKKRRVIILGLLLVIGFASIATNLVINGSVKIGYKEKDFDVFFSEAILDEENITNKAVSTSGKNITFRAKDLSIVGENTILDYEVTNASKEYGAYVEVVCGVEETNESDIKIEEYLEIKNDINGKVINPKTKEKGKLTIELKKGLLEEVEVTIGCKLKVEAKGTEEIGNSTESKEEISGYLIDEENQILPNTKIVIYGSVTEKGPKVVRTLEDAYLTIGKLEIGSYIVYVVNEDTEETKEEVEKEAITKVEFTSSSSLPIEFENKYKIVETLNGLTYKVKFNEGSIELKEVKNGETYGELPILEKEGYTFKYWETEDKIEITEETIVNLKSHQNLYAKWEANKYMLTFNSNGGSEIEAKEVEYDSAYGELEVPKKEGYNFIGWYLNDEEITSEKIVKIIEDRELVARWSAKGIKVTFNSNGGSEIEPKEVEYDGLYGELQVPIKKGYSFLGWYKDEELTEKVEETTKVDVEEDITLYAKWSANKYVVSFDTNGGNNLSPIEVTYNGIYENIKTPEKVGYTFIGWYLNDILVTNGERVTITENITLVARYEANKYIITLDTRGGKVSTNSLEVEYDSTYASLPIPEKVGYTFIGWYNGNEKIEKTSKVRITENETFEAKWEANKYIVTFNAGIGSVTTTSKEITYDGEYGSLPMTEKEGYIFNGWYTLESGGNQVTNKTKVTTASNHTLYAQFTAKTGIVYTVKHWAQNIGGNANKHDSANYTLVKTDTLTGKTDEKKTPAVNTYTGFTSPSTQSITIKADGSSELNYYYTRKSYTLTINKSTGVASVTGGGQHQYGESVTIGYTISAGYTYSSITGDKTSKTFTMPASNVTVKVNATENTYTISYTMNNGTNNSSNPTSYKVTSNNITLASPTRTGYTFTGWTGSNGTTAQKSVTIPKGSTGNKNYIANWKANTYTVSFDSNGGSSVTTTLTVTYDGTYGTLPNATRDGYTFDGWYTLASGGTKIESTNRVYITQNVSLFAHWTQVVWKFGYTGSSQTFTAPYDGNYKIELWGASGAMYGTYSGNGAYTSGETNLSRNKPIYVQVGGTGSIGTSRTGGLGGYNGGAKAQDSYNTGTGNSIGNGGGGATDIRLTNGAWNNFESLKSRIMVAAGGGGSGYHGKGGDGGTLKGFNGSGLSGSQGIAGYGYGGYQNIGGGCLINSNSKGENCTGSFGYANTTTYYSTKYVNPGSGGGGGYYGGGSSSTGITGYAGGSGGGGSSFISGHSGCNAIDSSSIASNIVHTGQANHYSGYVFTNTVMKGGNASMPTHDGKSTMTGNIGNGYAKITFLGK